MPYETNYSLPDGTKLIIELPSITNGVPGLEKWTREGWIECCGVSAGKLIESDLGVDVRFRMFSTDMYAVKIVEEVTDAARKQELMAQVNEYYSSRENSPYLQYWSNTVSYSPLDASIYYPGEFTGRMMY